MEKYFTNRLLVVGLLSLIIFGIIYYNNDYMEFKERKCVVLDKMITSGGYKSSGCFYLVLKEEKGVIFDLIVSPATFSQSKIGDIKHFNLRQLEIKQTSTDNLIYLFGSIIFGVISFVCLIGGLILKYIIEKVS